MFRLVFVFIFLPVIVFSQRYLPTGRGEVIQHTELTLSYVEKHEQAEWVYYESSSEMTDGVYKRKDNFRADGKVATVSASLADYSGSGYDRGHLAPAQDMKATAGIMSESFYLSNMSPQLPSFNRGGNWRKLEDAVHNWGHNNVVVVTGPVFQNNLGVIGMNNVTIPSAFYKVVYWPTQKKMIGFVIPHKSDGRSLQECIVPVDKIERITAIDFFPQLENILEDNIEAEVILDGWSFSKPNSTAKNSSATAVQKTNKCNGVTKNGTQCKRNATQGKRFCYQHG